MKLLSVVVPCYNSESYMSHAVESCLSGGEEMEIILVDDGSSDSTRDIALSYQKRYPGIVKVISQENGGHGEAVNTGLKNASGIYFKVVDSDDWLNTEALDKVLEKLRELVENGSPVDLFICNYVYEKVNEEKKKVISYRASLPQDKIFGWNDTKHFRQGHYILMHSAIYRTKLLKDCGLVLPKHTFYVDNIFVYQPLPNVKTMYYMDVNLYRYFIGRDDQSVTEANMIKRIDQQLYVTRYMIECCDPMVIKNAKLRDYMIKYLEIMMTVSSTYLVKAGDEESLKKKEELWEFLKKANPPVHKKIAHSVLGASMNFNTEAGRGIVKLGYIISKKIFKFG